MAIALAPDPAAALRERLANAGGGAGGEPGAAATPYAKRAQAELLQIIARTRLLVQQFDEHAEKLHDAGTCQARRVRQIHAVKEKFLNLPRILAQRLVGLKREDIERELLAELQAACNSFAAEAP